jgi:hypothetical protein
MSTLAVNTITNAAGGNTAQINGMTPTADSLQGFRNRIINGDMRIDQRNAGASVTITNTAATTYTLDRWAAYGSVTSKFSVQQNAGAVTAPTGFTNYFGATSLTAYSVGSGEQFSISQAVEGFNTADLGWGTSAAQTVTISFWVRSSLTGTFGGSLRNSAANRSYPFTFAIGAANTWEQKTITVAGDTTGTWLTDSGIGIRVFFSLGSGSTVSGTAGAWAAGNFVSATGATSVVGTNGATFYITGVQLEAGSVATPFERRPYGTELELCRRYFQSCGAGASGRTANSTSAELAVNFKTQMRASPTLTLGGFSGGTVTLTEPGVGNRTMSALIGGGVFPNVYGAAVGVTISGGTTGAICYISSDAFGASAEL